MVQAISPTTNEGHAAEVAALDMTRRSMAPREVLYTPDRPALELYVLLAGRVSVAHVTYEGKRLVTDLLGPEQRVRQPLVGRRRRRRRDRASGRSLRGARARPARRGQPRGVRPAMAVPAARGDDRAACAARPTGWRSSRTPRRRSGSPPRVLRYASDDDRTARASHRRSRRWRERTERPRQEIAEVAGTYRETATRVLNALQARGALRLARCAIRIEDEDELASLAHRAPVALAG